MARKALDIGIRLERQEKKILKLRQELEEAQDLYEKIEEVHNHDSPRHSPLLLKYSQKPCKIEMFDTTIHKLQNREIYQNCL